MKTHANGICGCTCGTNVDPATDLALVTCRNCLRILAVRQLKKPEPKAYKELYDAVLSVDVAANRSATWVYIETEKWMRVRAALAAIEQERSGLLDGKCGYVRDVE